MELGVPIPNQVPTNASLLRSSPIEITQEDPTHRMSVPTQQDGMAMTSVLIGSYIPEPILQPHEPLSIGFLEGQHRGRRVRRERFDGLFLPGCGIDNSNGRYAVNTLPERAI